MRMRGGWALHREKAETPVSATRFVMHTNCSHADNLSSFFLCSPFSERSGLMRWLLGFPWVWGFEINSPLCMASTLPTEPFPQPSYDCLDSRYKKNIDLMKTLL